MDANNTPQAQVSFTTAEQLVASVKKEFEVWLEGKKTNNYPFLYAYNTGQNGHGKDNGPPVTKAIYAAAVTLWKQSQTNVPDGYTLRDAASASGREKNEWSFLCQANVDSTKKPSFDYHIPVKD